MKTKSIQEGMEAAFKILAIASLTNQKKERNTDSIETESARIERCVEYYYKTDKSVLLDYPGFVSKFLQDNYKEITSGNKFSSLYLDDLPEGKEREYYMEDASILI